MSIARLNTLKLSNFRVKVKVRGKWKTAKRTAQSITVPRTATEYRLEFKPGQRWLKVKSYKGKRKKDFSLGAKRALKALRSPDETTQRKYSTAYEAINRKLEGQPWQIRPRAIRALPQWEKGQVFFTDPVDLEKDWKQVAVWYAIEAEGFSDGTPVQAGTKAWYVDAVYFEISAEKLSGSMVTRFFDLVGPMIAGPKGEVETHNARVPKDYKFAWKMSFVLLAVEGVSFEVSGGGRIRRKIQRSGARKQVSSANGNGRVRHGNGKRDAIHVPVRRHKRK